MPRELNEWNSDADQECYGNIDPPKSPGEDDHSVAPSRSGTESAHIDDG